MHRRWLDEDAANLREGEKIRVSVTQEGLVKLDQQTLSPPEDRTAPPPITGDLSKLQRP